jgi:alkylation response protein AidB-like acyl-CoA dehydrogenase
VIAEGSVLWDVFKKHRELGLHKMGIPKAAGGMMEDVPPMAGILIAEQMGYADAGLAISLGVSSMPFALAMMSPEAEIRKWAQEYAEDTECHMIGCWGITEPDHGSDWIIGTTPAGADPRLAPSFRAVEKGDEYVLNGRKSAWVSNGTIATHAVLHVGLDPSKGMHGQGLALCPLDLPGISRGKPLDKIGQRALNQGEIIFEEVKLPKKYMMIANPDLLTGMGRMFLGTANSGMGITFSGLAQAAFDEALNYAKERIQGGVPIIEHQNIKLKLFNMFAMVESARSFARQVAQYNRAKAPMGSGMHGIASKILITETAFKVASEGIQILGGYGLSKEYPIEKMFRDARASMIEDGSNESLALAGAEDL